MSIVVDIGDLRSAILDWANKGAAEAMTTLGERARDKAPYGTSDDPRKSGPHLANTLETIITNEGETWTGQIAFTADYASYVDEGRGPIEGNPLLYFHWQGHLISVRSVGPQAANPFFSDNVNDAAWVDALDASLGTLA